MVKLNTLQQQQQVTSLLLEWIFEYSIPPALFVEQLSMRLEICK